MLKASVFTLGCRVNQYESDALEESLKKRGFEIVPFGSPSDAVIINTCTVTAESDRKSRQHIRRAVSASPGACVVVTGCFAQVSPGEAARLEGVSLVVGNRDKNRIPDMICEYLGAGGACAQASGDSPPELSVEKPKRARCHIKIQDGCTNKCAYCIIPRARGAVVSKKPDKVIAEAAAIAATGCKEIIFTGIETASYGADLEGCDLSELLMRADSVAGIERIGTSSLDPSVMREDFVCRLAQMKHLLPHFHLSVQSGSTGVLNRMRRKYKAQTVLENMERVRRYIPEATFSADVIVGFPGETEEEFSETVEFCKKARFMHLHIFPYSKREGTEAAEMPNQIPDAEKKRRSAYLADVQNVIKGEILDDYIRKHGDRPVYVLGEKWENGITNGHTQHFIECDIKTAFDGTGRILPVCITGRDGFVLKGRCEENA